MKFSYLCSLIQLALVLPLLLLFSCGGSMVAGGSSSGGVTSFSISWPSFPSSGILNISSKCLGKSRYLSGP